MYTYRRNGDVVSFGKGSGVRINEVIPERHLEYIFVFRYDICVCMCICQHE
jgi:hypothetical protein